MKVAILSTYSRFIGGFNILYPFYKFEEEFKKNNVEFIYFTDHRSMLRSKFDVYFIIGRYFQFLKQKKRISDEQVIEFCLRIKNRGGKIIYFDTSDSSGSRFFQYIPFVDLFIKKQLLKDRFRYTLNEGDKSVRVWINSTINKPSIEYTPCPKDQLDKLELGYNIGFCDYRTYPKYLGTIFNRFHFSPKFHDPARFRKYNSVFRGTVNSDNTYSFQRNKLLEVAKKQTELGILTGPKVGRKIYLKELGESKYTLSPFGWGELCYRDFESIYNGSILVKPIVDHISTFPDVFIENETYIPLNWSCDNATDVAFDINNNYDKYLKIAKNAQEIYMNIVNDSKLFTQRMVNHFHLVLG